ncbi:MAG: helix-turn-helix transcriptional regulator, partial [Pseudomonadota bacterium]
ESTWDKFGDEYLRDLVLVGHYLHQRASQIMGDDKLPDDPPLSPRERDVLMLLSLGSSRAEAADKLRISQHTLRDYLDAARDKLGAQNTTHAVATAMVRGLLLP